MSAEGGPEEVIKENAVILCLARESDLHGLMSSIKSLEETFNHHCQ